MQLFRYFFSTCRRLYLALLNETEGARLKDTVGTASGIHQHSLAATKRRPLYLPCFQLLKNAEDRPAACVQDAQAALAASGTSLGVSAALEALLGQTTPGHGGLSWEERASLVTVLGALSSRLGTALLFAPCRPWGCAFVGRPLAEREAMLLKLSTSPVVRATSRRLEVHAPQKQKHRSHR